MMSYCQMKKWTVTVACVAALTGCVTKTRNDDFAGTKNHVLQEVMIDAKRDERPKIVNRTMLISDNSGINVDLEKALAMLERDEWRVVDYQIDNHYDKGNPKSPFHDKLNATTFYKPPQYKGYDLWVNEKGADVNASIEYWLAVDAISKIKSRQIAHVPPEDRIGGVMPDYNAYGREIHATRTTYDRSVSGLQKMLQDMIAYGVDKKTAMVTAYLCNGGAFNQVMQEHETEFYKVARENVTYLSDSEREFFAKIQRQKDYYLGYPGPLLVGNDYSPANCDEMRQKITKDENSPFWGDKIYKVGGFKHTGRYPNQTVTELRFDNPKMDVGFWQHIMNKDLYKGVGRVREEGLFSGLLYPERAKFVVLSDPTARSALNFSIYGWQRYFNYSSVTDDAQRAAYWMGDTMFSWHWDKDNAQGEILRKQLNKQFGNFMSNNGIERSSIAGCSLHPAQVSFQGDNAKEFRKFYRCRMGKGVGYGIFSGIRKGFLHTAAMRSDIRHQYQAVFEFNGLTTDLRKKEDCDKAQFIGLCKSLGPNLLQDHISVKQMQSYFVFDDVLSYTQISEEGRIEGVVLVAGFKLIYDLTDIAKWYQSYHPHNGYAYKDLMERFEHGNELSYKDERY